MSHLKTCSLSSKVFWKICKLLHYGNSLYSLGQFSEDEGPSLALSINYIALEVKHSLKIVDIFMIT